MPIVRLQPLRRLIDQVRDILRPQTAFPDSCDAPTPCQQLFFRSQVPLDVPGKFRTPEITVCVWDRGEATMGMPMPEAAMHENDRRIFAKHEIGFAREILSMQAETEPASVECATHSNFRLGILCADSAHHS